MKNSLLAFVLGVVSLCIASCENTKITPVPTNINNLSSVKTVFTLQVNDTINTKPVNRHPIEIDDVQENSLTRITY